MDAKDPLVNSSPGMESPGAKAAKAVEALLFVEDSGKGGLGHALAGGFGRDAMREIWIWARRSPEAVGALGAALADMSGQGLGDVAGICLLASVHFGAGGRPVPFEIAARLVEGQGCGGDYGGGGDREVYHAKLVDGGLSPWIWGAPSPRLGADRHAMAFEAFKKVVAAFSPYDRPFGSGRSAGDVLGLFDKDLGKMGLGFPSPKMDAQGWQALLSALSAADMRSEAAPGAPSRSPSL